MRHTVALNNNICDKPARKIALRSSAFVCLAWILSGCQPEQTRRTDASRPILTTPPVVESLPSQSVDPTPNIVIESTPQVTADQPIISQTEAPAESLIRLDPVTERLNEAAQALAEGTPTTALERINSLPLDALSTAEIQKALALKEQAFDALELPVLAIQTGLERLFRQTDPIEPEALETLIARAQALPDDLKQLHRRSGSQLAGVIDALALGQAPNASQVARWQRRYPNHLLSRVPLPRFSAFQAPLVGTPKITVLLPLTGPLGTAGRAVRDGVVAAWAETSETETMDVSVVDSTTLSDAELSQLADGLSTDLLIGPLDRNRLARLAEATSQIPILGLNRLPAETLGHDQLFQFALAIEDDASSAVEWARQRTPSPHILALVSDSPLGDRTVTALNNELTAVGGRLAGVHVMTEADKGELIADALGVNASDSRRRALSRLIGIPLTSTPRIRQDLTAVVVQSDAQTSRQIRPLLTYYYLRDVPVYVMGGYSSALATYSEDLANSSILVTPWDLGTSLKAQLRSIRPEVDAPIGALMALGADAFEAARRILKGEPLTFRGETGYLALNAQGIFTRQLDRLEIDRRGQFTAIPWTPALSSSTLETSERAF